jgi:hypothetical protein
LIFNSEDEKTVYTRYGILENIKKPGLVKEALGNLFDLTPDTNAIYNRYTSVTKITLEPFYD